MTQSRLAVVCDLCGVVFETSDQNTADHIAQGHRGAPFEGNPHRDVRVRVIPRDQVERSDWFKRVSNAIVLVVVCVLIVLLFSLIFWFAAPNP